MPLFAVERDLSHFPPEQFRADLQTLLAVCEQLKREGKRVRYISSAVFPAEARGLCLFGAEEPRLVREANETARLPYSRIFAVLDLTPGQVRRDLSRGRAPARRSGEAGSNQGGAGGWREGPGPTRIGDDMARWCDDGRRLLGLWGRWLDGAGQLRSEAAVAEKDRDLLAGELKRLQDENDLLRAQRDELAEAFGSLAGQMSRVADEILDRFGGRSDVGGLADR